MNTTHSPIRFQSNAILAQIVVVALLVCSHSSQLACAGTVTKSQTAPTVNGADIAQLVGTTDGGGDDGHIWSNRPVQGQTFTTLANPAGYTLSAITLQNLNNNGTQGPFSVQVGTNSGTTLSPIATETSGNLAIVSLDYVTFTFTTPVSLLPNTTYGFDWGTTGNGFVTSNGATAANPYVGGTAYSSGTNSVPNNASLTIYNRDRVFHLDITAVPEPSSLALAVFGLISLIGISRRRAG